MAKLLLGKEVNASINEEIKAKVEKLKAQDITPTLGIIRIGEREDDIAYEKSAAKRCDGSDSLCYWTYCFEERHIEEFCANGND